MFACIPSNCRQIVQTSKKNVVHFSRLETGLYNDKYSKQERDVNLHFGKSPICMCVSDIPLSILPTMAVKNLTLLNSKFYSKIPLQDLNLF